MPSFRVVVHGVLEKPLLSESGNAPVHGFYTVRTVSAESSEAAGLRAIAMVQSEENYSRLTADADGAGPELVVEEVTPSDASDDPRPSGYAFYDDDET